MTKTYTYTFKTYGGAVVTIVKEFKTYMQAMKFGCEYAAKNDVNTYTMT